MSDRRDAQRYLADLEALGFRVVLGGKGHWKIYDGKRLITTHGETPGGHRGLLNFKATMRRYMRARETST